MLPYESMQEFEYCCQMNQIRIVEVKYEEKISCKIELPIKEEQKVLLQIRKRKIKIEKCEIIVDKNIRKR